MPPTGMVHALQTIHQLLEPEGILIDIHPTGVPARVEVHSRQAIELAGFIQETDGYVEYGQADDALATVIKAGLFSVEREDAFDFLTYADNLAALLDYQAREWVDSYLEDETVERIRRLIAAAGQPSEIVLRERVRMTRLRVKR